MAKKTEQHVNTAALELIMQDVLQGMQEFTEDACRGSDIARMDIISVERACNTGIRTARILPFGGSRDDSGT